MTADERLSASRVVEATPTQVFAVLCDPDGHVAMDSSGMLQSATGTPVAQVGDGFVVHMDRESLGDYDMGLYDVTVRITEFEPDTAIEWTIESVMNIGHRFGYELRATDDGTEVTSYCDWSTVGDEWKDIFPVIDTKALRASLGLLERAVRRGYPRPAAS